jgi:hypothetical protein
MICPAMNTEPMGTFLAQVSAAHAQDFIVMVVDGASSHVAKALVVPENIRLHRWPAYSPELNPQEHLWDELREKEFPNRVPGGLSFAVRRPYGGTWTVRKPDALPTNCATKSVPQPYELCQNGTNGTLICAR